MWSIIPVFAIVLVQAQPDPPSKSGKWCFDRGQDTLLCEETEAECAKLRDLNTGIAKSPCRRVEPPDPPKEETKCLTHSIYARTNIETIRSTYRAERSARARSSMPAYPPRSGEGEWTRQRARRRYQFMPVFHPSDPFASRLDIDRPRPNAVVRVVATSSAVPPTARV
jgi:hypothetical protein